MRIALVGPPNAGKSSLLNALAGHEAAIVSPLAGTTRDTVQVQLELAGVKVRCGVWVGWEGGGGGCQSCLFANNCKEPGENMLGAHLFQRRSSPSVPPPCCRFS